MSHPELLLRCCRAGRADLETKFVPFFFLFRFFSHFFLGFLRRGWLTPQITAVLRGSDTTNTLRFRFAGIGIPSNALLTGFTVSLRAFDVQLMGSGQDPGQSVDVVTADVVFGTERISVAGLPRLPEGGKEASVANNLDTISVDASNAVPASAGAYNLIENTVLDTVKL